MFILTLLLWNRDISECGTGLWHHQGSQVALVVKNPPANAGDARDLGSIPGSGRPLEKEMATHSSTLAWRIPWTEETPWGCKESDTTEWLNTLIVTPSVMDDNSIIENWVKNHGTQTWGNGVIMAGLCSGHVGFTTTWFCDLRTVTTCSWWPRLIQIPRMHFFSFSAEESKYWKAWCSLSRIQVC